MEFSIGWFSSGFIVGVVIYLLLRVQIHKAIDSVIHPKRLVKSIEITRDTTGKVPYPERDANNPDWRTFLVGELLITKADGTYLPKDAFESATYGADNTDKYTTKYPPTNAYDGDINVFSHTSGPQSVHKLTVVLKEPQDIKSILVMNGNATWRMDGAVLVAKDANGVMIKQQVLTTDVTSYVNI